MKYSMNARSIYTTGVCWNKYFRQVELDGLERAASEIRRDDGRKKLFLSVTSYLGQRSDWIYVSE
jgi:hypothetical protein